MQQIYRVDFIPSPILRSQETVPNPESTEANPSLAAATFRRHRYEGSTESSKQQQPPIACIVNGFAQQPTSAAPIRFHHGFLVPGSCGCTKQAKGQRRVPDSYFCRLFAAGGFFFFFFFFFFFLFLFLFLLNQGIGARALRAWGTVVQDPDGALQLSLRKGLLSTQARSSTAGVVTPWGPCGWRVSLASS